MTQKYIGVKMVDAWEQEQDGVPGYAVKYPDGYVSWSPKEVFESAYLPMGEQADGSSVTAEMVTRFLPHGPPELQGRMANHGVCCYRTLAGFTLVEESACVDPEKFSYEKAQELTREKAESKVWFGLGLVLAWARNGLARRSESEVGEGAA